MKIIIMRHGQASYFGADRVLTAEGRQEAELTALKLASHAHITKVYASPKTRAQQTAQAVVSRLPGRRLNIITEQALTPAGDPFIAVEQALLDAKENDEMLLISHIPLVEHLSHYLCPSLEIPLFVTAAALIVAQKDGKWHPEAFITPHGEHFFDAARSL